MASFDQHSALIPLYRQLVVSTLLALVAILAYFILPEHRDRILPDLVGSEYHLFFDGQSGGQTKAEWIDKSSFKFTCTVANEGLPAPYCGMSINIGKSPTGKDYASHQRIEIKVDYQGGNQRLRLSMHNFNPANSALNNREILKGLDVTFLANETASPITIHNYGWREPDNRNRNKNPLSWLNTESPENLLDIGIDLAPPIAVGEHLIQIEYIDLYGKLLSAEAWYLGVALIWLLFNLLLFARHLIIQAQRIRNDSQRLSTLVNYSHDLQQESQHYKWLSHTDQLTNALNRNGFATAMSQQNPDGKMKSNTSLLIIDLDNFKRINDTLGHDTGDMVLRETAQIIQKNIRVSDKFVRWGGEEFILLCDATNVKQALLIAEKIRVSIEAAKMTHNDGNISITASIGIGVAKSDENFDDLFQRTDQALYRAKNMGRNCVALSESDR